MAVIGIDLGTTNSLASVWLEGRIQLIPNSFGEYLTPSVVSFGEQGEVFVGRIAQEMRITNPGRTFQEFKRNMGSSYRYYVGKEAYSAEELSAFVLRRLREDAQQFLGEAVTEAVISVPAYFDDNKRCATKRAGELAGLYVERLVNEPSAVALKHHLDENVMETFLIFDLGGGTLDVSLVEAFDNMVEIQAVAGDNYLGGKDFNEKIAEYFYQSQGIDKRLLSLEEQGIVLKEAEALKQELTEKNEAGRSFFLSGKEFRLEMTNQKLIHISRELFQRMTKPVQKVLKDADMQQEDIDKVILVGGSSRMPIVARYMESLGFAQVITDDMPDESIAVGVGTAAAIKERAGEIKDVILADICPFSLGTQLYDGSFSPIINRNETLPCSRTSYYVTVQNNQTELTFPIYQGENLRAADNLKLGEMKIKGLPKAPKGEVGAKVTFLYDINGILDIQIVADDEQTLHKVIMNKQMGLSDKELEERVEQLRRLTMHPLEQEENRLLIERAKRLYCEAGPGMRGHIAGMLRYFQETVSRRKGRAVREAYARFSIYLESVERGLMEEWEFDESFWEEDEEE